MRHWFQIGEIAELLQISSSKLRFWEQQGLLKLERNKENNYRQYSFLDLLHISDIIFYRDLYFSTKELKQLFCLSAGELEQLLQQKQWEVDAKIDELQQTSKKIQLRCHYLQEAAVLREHPYRMGRPDFSQIRLVCEQKTDDWRRSILDQNASVGFQTDARAEAQYCLLAEADEDCIWRLDMATTYAEALLRYAVQDDSNNNVEEHCAALQAMGWQTGCVISRYLFTSMEDGVSYDYYKGWIAIEKGSVDKQDKLL